MLKKYRPSIDFMLIAMTALASGHVKVAAESMKKATASSDFKDAIRELEKANSELFEDPEEEDLSEEDPALDEELSRLLAASEEEEEGEDDDDEEEEEEKDEEEVSESALARLQNKDKRQRNMRALMSRTSNKKK